MKVLLVGGGTGGHITPLLAVAHELKKTAPAVELSYIGEKHGKFTHLITENGVIDTSYLIFAGKFRRYHGESFFTRVLDLKTNLLNLRDMVFTVVGFFQTLWLLARHRPNVIFIKGGFVSVPVGIAAFLLRVPFITHDSDTVPGLANRIVGRWAKLHATGMPANFYTYPPEKVRFVGIPLAAEYTLVTSEQQRKAKKTLGVPEDAQVVVITGGIQGAQRINEAARIVIPEMLSTHENIYVFHHVGKGNQNAYGEFRHSRLHLEEFFHDFHQYLAAADVVITRGSATTLAELGIQQKAAIVIPSPFLAGGHQVKNAMYLTEHEAAVVIDEHSLMHNPPELQRTLEKLLDDPHSRQQLGRNLQVLTKADAAKNIAKLLVELAA